MDKEKFEKLKALVVELDTFLTEKASMAAHMMVSQGEQFEIDMLDKGEFVYYLADGGLSRIVLKFHPNFESYCNPTVFFTSNSMQKVKDRWSLEDAQDLITDMLELMFTPDQTMVDQFKTEASDRASEIDPQNEQDWYSLTLGWAIAKGLSPANAIFFACYIRYRTDLG